MQSNENAANQQQTKPKSAMSRYCQQCGKTQTLCVCQQCRKHDTKTKVIILQHPDEVKRPLGTAVIAKLCLKQCTLYVGEDFSKHQQLNDAIAQHKGQIAVLFPSEHAQPAKQWRETHCKQAKLIIVLDGTWRKAFKMWQLSTNLHALVQLALPEDLKGQYRLRKAPNDNALSTVESIAELLRITEQDSAASDTLHKVFTYLIDQQWQCIPDEVKKRNYRPST